MIIYYTMMSTLFMIVYEYVYLKKLFCIFDVSLNSAFAILTVFTMTS